MVTAEIARPSALTFPALVHPENNALPNSKELGDHIAQHFNGSPFRYFVELKELKRDLLNDLKLITCELAVVGSQSSLFTTDQARITNTLRHLNVFISHARVLPHDKTDSEYLSYSVNEVQESLLKLYSCTSNQAAPLALELDSRLKDLSLCADDFFMYEARKYAIIAYGSSRGAAIPLHVPYSTLNKLTGDPQAWAFDIDDCMIFSESAQRDSWKIAIESWATKKGYLANDPEGVQRLVRCVRYCLEKDRTAGLLQLLVDVCQRRGFSFECSPNKPRTAALEETLMPYRAQFLSDCVDDGRVTFTPGAHSLVEHALRDGKLLGFCTSSPRAVSEAMLTRLFDGQDGRLLLDQVFPQNARVFGDSIPQRKPLPLGWLMVASSLGVRPGETLVFDNSLNNCVGAAELSTVSNHPVITSHSTHIGRDLVQPGEEFAGVVGTTNGVGCLDQWRSWAGTKAQMPVKVVLYGLDRIGI